MMRTLGTCDLYSVLATLFKYPIVATSLPELQFRDIYMHLAENCPPYAAATKKAFKLWTASCILGLGG